MSWIDNAWYVAAWDWEVDRAPFARTICGVPVVLYRKLDGDVVAMRDACPHRLLPLSMGIKEGDSLRAYAIDEGGARARRIIEKKRQENMVAA